MKLDGDSPVLHPIPVLKTFEHGDDIVDPTELKRVKKIPKEQPDVLLREDKGNKLIAVPVPSDLNDDEGFWPVPDFDSSTPYQDLMKGEGNAMVKATEGNLLQETELLKRDLNIYTDKKVTDFELPGVVNCKDDSSYHEIKDICMDKGVVSDEKLLFETNGDSTLVTFLLSDKEVDGGSMKEKSEIESSIPDVFKVMEDHCPADPVGKCRPEHLVDSVENSAPEDFQHDSSAAHGDKADQQSAKALHDEPIAGSSAAFHASEETPKMKSCEEVTDDSDSLKPPLPADREIELGSKGKEAISETQAERGTVTFSLAALPTPSDRHDSLHNGSKEVLDNQEGPKLDGSHAYFGRDQHSHGETSFSVLAGPPSSSLISYSGPMAYSGSLSLRSDSSTTSTRSFAFPVLQNEWNSSPVRMAKGDRRQYRKRFGWRRRLLCCKF